METVIILWLWIQAMGFFLMIGFGALFLAGAAVWVLVGWLWGLVQKWRA